MTYEDKDFDESLICSECVGNEILLEIFKSEGTSGTCDFDPLHSDQHKVVSFGSFCNEVDELFRECYGIAERVVSWDHNSDYYGDSLEYTIGELVECDESVQNHIMKYLLESEMFDVSSGEEGFYNDLINYEAQEHAYNRHEEEYAEYIYENRVGFKWDDFSELVKYKKRFFSIQNPLDEIFGDLKEYAKGTRSPIRYISEGETIFRARKVINDFQVSDIKNDTFKKLGPPPVDKAIAGRMNVQHIPAFYGAFSDDLAIKEVQPVISEQVAVGQFKLLKPIKVFDFTIFDLTFDSDYKDDKEYSKYSDSRYDIVTQLHDKISEPVSPYSKSLDYIPTQILTEYIKEHFEVDGIVYFSSLVGYSKAEEKRNIVIFQPDEGLNFSDIMSVDDNLLIKKINDITYDISTVRGGFPF